MSIPLAQKIEQLKQRYQGESSLPPHEALAIDAALLDHITDLHQRLAVLEGRAVPYKEPRG